MIEYIFLGIIQGIFEWLPVSSEGMIALLSNYLISGVNPVDVALFLHLGTLVAVLVYFRKDWEDVIYLRDKKLIRFLIITTVASLVVGFFVYKSIRTFAVGNGILLVVGLGLLLTSLFHSVKKKFSLDHDSLALFSGLLQGLAVIPGLSRSGSTIFGLSLGKFKPEEILKYSYLMSVPVVAAAALLIVFENPAILSGWPALVSSFIVGYLTLDILMKFADKINFSFFTFLFGLLCILGWVVGLFV